MNAIGTTASLRWRLAAWYTAALGALLLVLGAVALVLLDRSLRANIDSSLASIAEALATSSDDERAGLSPEDALTELFGPALGERFFQLLDPRGRPESTPHSEDRLTLTLSDTARRNASAGRETWETVSVPGAGGPIRVLTLPVIEHGAVAHLVQVALPLSSVYAARTRFLLILLGLAPLALGGIAVGGWLLVGRALSPVDAMTDAARRISAEDLSLRIVTEGRDDELGRLASVLNDMLARLDRSFAAVRDFSADAAHELRTPLTILKGEIEVALRTTNPSEDSRGAFESCLEEVDRLSALLEDLLFLARADANAVERPCAAVDLAAVLDDAEPALVALAERSGVTLAVHGRGPVWIAGSAPMLLRIVFNLAENAIKFSGPGRRVDIGLRTQGDAAALEVCDNGPGVPAADHERIFERFCRGDSSRAAAGAGLGLALVRSIVAIHGGRITLESEDGKGACFRIEIPTRPEA